MKQREKKRTKLVERYTIQFLSGTPCGGPLFSICAVEAQAATRRGVPLD